MKNNTQRDTANRDAKNALVNILLFPGLGSLKSGRVGEGIGQLVLVLAGCTFILIWFFKVVSQYYGLMFGDIKPQSVGWIGIVGGVLTAISWLWACVTSLSLFRDAAKASAAPPPVLPPTEAGPVDPKIRAALRTLPAWKLDGQVITRVYEFEDFPAAMKFVNTVAALAEQAQHHPDIDVRWNKVTLALTTHDAGGLTERDFAVARECDARFIG